MHDPVHEETHNGYQIKIYHNPDPETPRDWSTFGTMVCWHRRYTLGDEHGFASPYEFLADLAGVSVDTDMSMGRLQACAERTAILLPVYLYDHSGLAINTVGFHCPWDSGQVGFIYVRLDDVRGEFGMERVTRKIRYKAEGVLRSEIASYDDYIAGRAYGFVIENTGDEIDSCWGFLGDHESVCLAEARQSIASLAKAVVHEAQSECTL